MTVWLIGAGKMAQDYAKVLEALYTPFKVIGRGADSSSIFSKQMGIQVQTGGVKKALEMQDAPETAIVAVRPPDHFEVASTLIKAGTRRILLEKPGGLYLEQIRLLNEIAVNFSANVWLAYNRRFYASTLKAEEMIEDEWKHCYTKEVAFYPDNRLIDNKYWPPVKRIDNVYGDRNLFCACPPIDEYENINKTGSG